jgi:hypothetical protein
MEYYIYSYNYKLQLAQYNKQIVLAAQTEHK